MLDYYGSIIKCNEQIDTELIQYFRNYNQNHILSIINKLRDDKILPTDNSVSGWNIFVRQFIIKEIIKILNNETLISQKKLQFAKYCNEYYINNDILYEISKYINS